MLSTDERQARDDVQRNHDAEAEELGRHRSSRGGSDARVVDDLPAMVVAGIWSAVFLVLFGEMAAALAVATATALGWASWRWVTAPGTGSGAATPRDDGVARAGESLITSGAAAPRAVAFGGVNPAAQGAPRTYVPRRGDDDAGTRTDRQ